MARIALPVRTRQHIRLSGLLAVAGSSLALGASFVPVQAALAATTAALAPLMIEAPKADAPEAADTTDTAGAAEKADAADTAGAASQAGRAAEPAVLQPAPPSGAAPTTPTPEPAGTRAEAYQQFVDHFNSRRFKEALPAAEQVVTLTEKQFGDDSEELIKPLLNLGTTQMRIGNLYAAESEYRRALRIAEARDGGYSRTVIAPLQGLGMTYQASGRYENAAESLRRAVDVSRKLDGLFNIQQLPLVEGLVESYIALDKRAEVDREQQYAMRLSENTYGRDDPRMLPVLARSADWSESTGRYRTARLAHARSLEILARTAPKRDPVIVPPLRGVARAYRLEYLYGSSEMADVGQKDFNPTLNSAISGIQPSDSRPVRLDPEGESALKLALSVLADKPELTGLKGETLLDLGDWYMLSSRYGEGQRTYREAWAALTAPQGPGPALMSQPVQLFYRPPNGANKRQDKDDDEMKQSYVEVEFKVAADGRVSDVKTVSTDGTEAQEKSVQIALRRTRYRPRFVEGKPVATTGVRYRQTLYSLIESPRSNR